MKKEGEEKKLPWKWLDRAMDYLLHADTQAFLDLLLGPGKVRFLGKLLAQKVDGDRLIIDALADTETVEGCYPTLVHIEFETAYSSKMGHRLLVYNEELEEKHPDQEVESGVFHLGKGKRLDPSPYVRTTRLRGSDKLIFHYTVKEIQDLTPDDLRALGSPALLALIPLTQGGTEWPVIQGMFRDLVAYGDHEIVKIAFQIAYWTVSPQLRKQLKEEYSMLYQDFRADPLYSDLMDDAREEGIQIGLAQGRAREEDLMQGLQQAKQQVAQQAVQGFQQTVISLVVRDYPELKELAQTRIAYINSIERLQGLILDLTLRQTQVEVGRLLLPLTPSQPQGTEQFIQATQKLVIDMVTRRFPELEQLAQSRLTKIDDLLRLQPLIPDFSVLSKQEVENVLDSLSKDRLPESAVSDEQKTLPEENCSDNPPAIS